MEIFIIILSVRLMASVLSAQALPTGYNPSILETLIIILLIGIIVASLRFTLLQKEPTQPLQERRPEPRVNPSSPKGRPSSAPATRAATPVHSAREPGSVRSRRFELRDIEPSNIPPVGNEEAAAFMRRLTGRESFEFTGDGTPRSVFFYELKFAHPRHSYAHGFLLSVGLDQFEAESIRHETLEPTLQKYVIGRITIKMGGTLSAIQVRAAPFRPPAGV